MEKIAVNKKIPFGLMFDIKICILYIAGDE